MIRGILFDMDGVLVDNAQVHYEAFGLFCRRYGVAEWKDNLAGAFGMGNDDIMRRLLPAEVIRERGLASLAAEKEAIYRDLYAATIQPVAGLRPLLERLTDAGIRCAVGSSGPRANVDFVLDRCAIRNYFTTIVDGDHVTRCKPDPEIYMTAAAGLGLAPSACLVFEDALAGIESARRAGVGQVVALATTLTRDELRSAAADRIIGDYTEIADLHELLR